MFLLEKEYWDYTFPMVVIINLTLHNDLLQWQINQKQLSIDTASHQHIRFSRMEFKSVNTIRSIDDHWGLLSLMHLY